MIRVLEIAGFTAFALLLHLAFALSFSRPEGENSAGSGGEAVITLAAAPPQIETMVEAWERPPETAQEIARPEIARPEAAAPPDPPPAVIEGAPILPRPDMIALPSAPVVPEAPQVDTLSAPPPEDVNASAVTTSKRPVQRPKSLAVTPKPKQERAKPLAKNKPNPKAAPAPKAQGASAGRAAQKAAGAGGGAQAGQGGKQSSATLSQGQEARMISVWGSRIRARIDRAKRSPPGRLRGRVVLRLTVQSSGALSSVSVARSSGHSALDQAAVGAVKRAGRLPRAPKGLPKSSYSFTLPVVFN
ncbi:hypothetical protein A9Q95_08900 [Rhodobacterales bacterium 59_46_T64]|nr:hypothetical protein A9Q95_08900 [Rhodobacterales bacterium 59_46_T64]